MEAKGNAEYRNCLLPYKRKGLLPAAAVFGKNGGGKSNVIRAFWLGVQFVRNAQRTQHESAEVPVNAFALNDYSKDMPTGFEYEYVQDENLDNLIFPGMTEEWLDFIVASRNGKGHRYDIVEGPMVDETIYNSIQNFIDGKISRMAFWELVKSQSPVRQISFHSVSALDTLTFMGSWKVKAFKNLFD